MRSRGKFIVGLRRSELMRKHDGRNVIDQMGMLEDFNGSSVSVVTAVTLGKSLLRLFLP